MTIEEAIKHMMHVWEQLNEKVIKLGTTIRKIFRDIFGQREVSLEISKNTTVRKRRYHQKDKSSVQYRYIPTSRRNLPYMRRSY